MTLKRFTFTAPWLSSAPKHAYRAKGDQTPTEPSLTLDYPIEVEVVSKAPTRIHPLASMHAIIMTITDIIVYIDWYWAIQLKIRGQLAIVYKSYSFQVSCLLIISSLCIVCMGLLNH